MQCSASATMFSAVVTVLLLTVWITLAEGDGRCLFDKFVSFVHAAFVLGDADFEVMLRRGRRLLFCFRCWGQAPDRCTRTVFAFCFCPRSDRPKLDGVPFVGAAKTIVHLESFAFYHFMFLGIRTVLFRVPLLPWFRVDEHSTY